MKERKSLLTKDMTKCYICGSGGQIHIHEVFFGSANRQKSIEDDCCIPLCPAHHNMSNSGIHFNHELDLAMKQRMQKAWVREYCDGDPDALKKFIKRFGKNYLN